MLILTSLVAFGGTELPSLAAAAELPRSAQTLREVGLDSDQVQQTLVALQKAGLNAIAANEFLLEASKVVDQRGPIEEFSAFVEKSLESGMRGAALLEVLVAEHETRGLDANAQEPPKHNGASTHQGASPHPNSTAPHPRHTVRPGSRKGYVVPPSGTKRKGYVVPPSGTKRKGYVVPPSGTKRKGYVVPPSGTKRKGYAVPAGGK